MPTLLLSRTFQPEADRLAVVAKQERWGCQWLEGNDVPKVLHGKDFGICAEIGLALGVASLHSFALIEPSFDLLACVPATYTQREIRFAILADALQLPQRAFIKPADCASKVFEAQVAETGKYLRCGTKVPRDTPVLITEPVRWNVEFRVIVLERRVVTFLSLYSRWPLRERQK